MDGFLPIPAELPKAGYAGQHPQSFALDFIVLLNNERHLRPWTDEGHVAFEHVEELREFIEENNRALSPYF